VEDDPVVRRALVILAKVGIPVLAVSSCFQANKSQQKEPADLIISDLQLPDGNGMDLLRQFKKTNPTVEVIIITGSAHRVGGRAMKSARRTISSSRYRQPA